MHLLRLRPPAAIFVLLPLALAADPSHNSQSCYYPDGSLAIDFSYTPCGPEPGVTSNYSACCVPSEGDVCLSSGLCQWPAESSTYRGGCTDPTWSDPACPNFCSGDQPDTYLPLIQCNSGLFCCPNAEEDCCRDGSTQFSVNGTSPAASAVSGSPSATASPGNNSKVTPMKPLTVGIIAAAIAAVIVFVVGGIVLCCCLKRRRNNGNSVIAPPIRPFEEHQMVDQNQSRPPTSYMPPPPNTMELPSPPSAYGTPSTVTVSAVTPYVGMHGDFVKPTSPAPSAASYHQPPHSHAVESDSRPVYNNRPQIFEMPG